VELHDCRESGQGGICARSGSTGVGFPDQVLQCGNPSRERGVATVFEGNFGLKQEHFTYGDYAKWSEDERWELIDGVAYAMAAPTRMHQLVVLKLGSQIDRYLENKGCAVYPAPFDVRLPHSNDADNQIDTTVQPDLAVICDKNKLDDKGCRGAPDWVVEVLSPSTALMDMDKKRRVYELHGVKEYWIIHPTDRWLMVYTLQSDGQYGLPRMVGMDEPTAVGLFPDLHIDWAFMQEA
jgi:Uma2 family endonuclease